MKNITISDAVRYVGCYDDKIELFENQYIIKGGVSYNSYVILDEKVAVMDTVDNRVSDEWIENLKSVLGDRIPDYLIVSHLEPDHSANIQRICRMFPNMKIVCSAKAAAMLPQFFEDDFSGKIMTVKEGDSLGLGSHTLRFFMAPMVHWPEVMVEYEETEKILFSADGFGRFGVPDADAEWDCDARRYYINIVGKYGMPVQTLLKKASSLDIKTICPLHGCILTDNLSYYIGKYLTWSSYQPEEKGVFIAYASIHGNTASASLKLADIIRSKGVKAELCDLTKCRGDVSQAVADAFRYDRMIVAAATYDGGIFPVMEDFLCHLKSKTYQKRTVGIMENGSWAAVAGKQMKAYFENMKDINIIDNIVTIKSTVKPDTLSAMEKLADEICK